MKFTETEIKYLAGILDADGSLFFHFKKYKDRFNVSLKLVLQQSESIDKNGKFIKSLNEKCGFIQTIELDNPNWSNANRLTITSNKELNMLLPRLLKHMVVKARHWDRLFSKYNSIYGKSVTEDEKNKLKEFSLASRKDVGPLKPKNHPTWAWIAGFIDGDGCYYMRTRKKGKGIWKELIVQVVSSDDDKTVLEFLHKNLGGHLKNNSYENTHLWTRNLGIKDRSFAIKFLRKMVRHSKLKKHKIESMLQYHLQRLSESTSKEEAIV
jgi:hypothetical protein